MPPAPSTDELLHVNAQPVRESYFAWQRQLRKLGLHGYIHFDANAETLGHGELIKTKIFAPSSNQGPMIVYSRNDDIVRYQSVTQNLHLRLITEAWQPGQISRRRYKVILGMCIRQFLVGKFFATPNGRTRRKGKQTLVLVIPQHDEDGNPVDL